MRSTAHGLLLSALILPLVFMAATYGLRELGVDWATVSLKPASTITVTGYGSEQQQNQVAEFSAGVTSLGNDRAAAVQEVNTKTQELVSAIKEFGIAEEDIKTQNLSVNQDENVVYEGDRQVSRPGQWRVNNTISIKLRDVERASELADLLSGSGATNVYGPNFMTDAQIANEDKLLKAAIEDAHEKALAMAAGAGKQLGETVAIVESGSAVPYAMLNMARVEGGGGGGASVLPGSSEVSKTVTVTYELK